MIYLDNAATSLPKPPEVLDAVVQALTTFGGPGRGSHEAAIAASMEVFATRCALAELFDAAGPEQISFAQNATAALNYALLGLIKPGSTVLTTMASHNSVLRPLNRLRDTQQVEVRIAAINPDVTLDVEDYVQKLPGVSVVALTHASNVTGDVYDIASLARMAHEQDALVVLDAAQTAGSIPVSMKDLDVDVLCFTGHKSLLGPQGTGGICVKPGVAVPPLLEGGSGFASFDERHPRIMPEALEAGTLNAHGIAGLHAGVAYLQNRGITVIAEQEQVLTRMIVERLRAMDSVVVYGRKTDNQTGVVAFSVDGYDASCVADHLAQEGICTRAGAHCAPLMHKALGTDHCGVVRASVGPFTSQADVDCLLDAVERFVG